MTFVSARSSAPADAIRSLWGTTKKLLDRRAFTREDWLRHIAIESTIEGASVTAALELGVRLRFTTELGAEDALLEASSIELSDRPTSVLLAEFRALAEWNEEDHPRVPGGENGGEFTVAGHGVTVSVKSEGSPKKKSSLERILEEPDFAERARDFATAEEVYKAPVEKYWQDRRAGKQEFFAPEKYREAYEESLLDAVIEDRFDGDERVRETVRESPAFQAALDKGLDGFEDRFKEEVEVSTPPRSVIDAAREMGAHEAQSMISEFGLADTYEELGESEPYDYLREPVTRDERDAFREAWAITVQEARISAEEERTADGPMDTHQANERLSEMFGDSSDPPTVEALAEAWGHPEAGFSIDINEIEADGDNIKLGGNILHEGTSVGTISRELYRDRDGKLTVYHGYFKIDDESLQGGGLGAAMFKKSIETYEKMGVDQIKVTTAWVGKYTWASFGYEWNDATAEQMEGKLHKYLVKHGVESERALAIAADASWHASDVATLDVDNIRVPVETDDGRVIQSHVGKAFLLEGDSWSGTFDLKDKHSKGYQRARERLFGEKKAEEKREPTPQMKLPGMNLSVAVGERSGEWLGFIS